MVNERQKRNSVHFSWQSSSKQGPEQRLCSQTFFSKLSKNGLFMDFFFVLLVGAAAEQVWGFNRAPSQLQIISPTLAEWLVLGIITWAVQTLKPAKLLTWSGFVLTRNFQC